MSTENNYKSGSNLEKVLKSGQFAFTGELGPPRGSDVNEVREKIKFLRGNVDSVNITDNQKRRVDETGDRLCHGHRVTLFGPGSDQPM